MQFWFPAILVQTFILHGLILILRLATTYRALEIGLDAFWIGAIGGAFGVLPALLGLHLGGMIDRVGETASLRVGSALVLLATFSFWISGRDPVVLAICSAALGFGHFISLAAQHSAVARFAPKERRDGFFGRFTVAISLAQAVSPGLLTLFGHDSPVPETAGIFLLGCGGGLLLVLVTTLMRLPARQPVAEWDGVWRAMLVLTKTRGFCLSMLSSLIIFAAIDLLIIYLPVYGAERDISAGTIGSLLALRAAASIASRLMFDRLIAVLGRGALLVAAMLLAGGGIALLPLTGDMLLMALALVSAGLGLGIGAPLTMAWVSDLSPASTQAMALSLRLAVNRVGQVLLPVGAGAVVAGVGAGGVFWAMAATLGASALLCTRYFRLWHCRR